MELFDRTFFAQLEGLRLLSRRQVQGRLFGEARGRRTGRAGEFADHRPYAPGDDLRLVDWPAFWRLRKAYIKLSESQEERPTCLALDATGSMAFGRPARWDYGRRLAAALAFVALDGGDSVRAFRFGARPEPLVPEMRGFGRFAELCESLKSAPLVRRGSVFECLERLPSLCPGRGVLLVLSDFLDPDESPQALSALAAARHEVVLVHLVSPWEAHPSLDRDAELEDMETGRVIRVGAGRRALDDYARAFNRFAEGLRATALRRGIRYLFARTDQPEISLVRRVLAVLR